MGRVRIFHVFDVDTEGKLISILPAQFLAKWALVWSIVSSINDESVYDSHFLEHYEHDGTS